MEVLNTIVMETKYFFKCMGLEINAKKLTKTDKSIKSFEEAYKKSPQSEINNKINHSMLWLKNYYGNISSLGRYSLCSCRIEKQLL